MPATTCDSISLTVSHVDRLQGKVGAQRKGQGAIVRRRFTDFPEYDEEVQTMGPWRAAKVEDGESPWLLVGRRHSVDERREAMQQGKVAFLRALAGRADGAWRANTAARVEQLQVAEQRVRAELVHQAQSLNGAKEFWSRRCSSDHAYLGELKDCAKSLPGGTALREAQWHAAMEKAAERSEVWARQLKENCEEHSRAAREIQQLLTSATEGAAVARNSVLSARTAVWQAAPSTARTPGMHCDDASGPEGACLWLQVLRYLSACGALAEAQVASLARVERADQRVRELGEWCCEVMGERSTECDTRIEPVEQFATSAELRKWSLQDGNVDGSDFGSCDGSIADKSSQSVNIEEVNEDEGESDVDEDVSDEEEANHTLDLSMDISALVVHEQEIEVFFLDDSEIDASPTIEQASAWIPSRLLLSVDLWLHLWTPCRLATESIPNESIPLVSACSRPVVEQHDDPLVLRLCLRPSENLNVLASLSALVWGTHDVRFRNMLLRCSDAKSCLELVAALDLVEKLYPLLA